MPSSRASHLIISGPRTANVIRTQQRHPAVGNVTAAAIVMVVILCIKRHKKNKSMGKNAALIGYLHYNTGYNNFSVAT